MPDDPKDPKDDFEEPSDTPEEDFFAADEEKPEEKPEVKTEEPPKVEAKAEAPVEPAAKVEPPPASPEKPTEPVAEAKPTPPPAEPAADPERLLAEKRATFVADLERSYALSPEEVEQAVSEPHVILPKLAARVHAALFEDVYRTFSAQLPQLVMGVLEGQNRIAKVKDDFYAEWPELKDHEADVEKVGQVYANMYPNSTTEERRREIGSMTMARLGIIRQAAPPAAAPARKLPPHRPSAAGVTAPAAPGAPARTPADMWAELIPD